MRVLVTGATGCLGIHLTKELVRQNYSVTALGRNRELGKLLTGAQFVVEDIRNREKMRGLCQGQEIVFHCAALSSLWGKYQDFYDINVLGSKNIFEACIEQSVKRVVYVSSPSIYYQFKDELNIPESTTAGKKFVNHYISTKILAEEEADQAFANGLDVVTIRPRGIFGPYDRSILPRLLERGKKGYLPLIDKGDAVIDVTYVENVVEALICAAKSSKECSGKKYNITNGEPLEIKKLLELLFHSLGKDISFISFPYSVGYVLGGLMESLYSVFPFAKEPPFTRYAFGLLGNSQTLDISLARKELGYTPKISIEEGLKRFAVWYKNL